MQTDAALVEQVIGGEDAAFDELYRRHASAAWRLAQSVTGNSHDAADAVSEAFVRVFQAVRAGRLERSGAFRSYLLTATRNAALDGRRKGGRAAPTDVATMPAEDSAPSTADQVAGDVDALLVAQAFRNLPERWRSMLWLTEVEGVATKDAAVLLGLSANGAAQLAVRARAGLRERFLQAHLRDTAEPGCRFTVDHLGAYVGGGLSPRDLAKVDQHLAGCAGCTARKEELEDLGSSLRRVVLPMPVALGAVSVAATHAAMAAPAAPALAAVGGAGATTRAIAWTRTPPSWFQRAVAASSAAVLAVGVASLGFHDVGAPSAEAAAGTVAPSATLPEPVAIDLAGQVAPVALGSADGVGAAISRTGAGPARPLTADAGDRRSSSSEVAAPAPAGTDPGDPIAATPAEPSEPSGAAPAAPASPSPGDALPPSPVPVPALPLPDLGGGGGGDDGGSGEDGTPTAPLADAGVGATIGDVGASLGVTADDPPSAGATVGDTTVGTPPPPPPADDGITLEVDSELLDEPVEVGLP